MRKSTDATGLREVMDHERRRDRDTGEQVEEGCGMHGQPFAIMEISL